MPTKRRDLDQDGAEVIAYTHEEAWNLAARTIANAEDDFGTFAMGVMVGMSVVDRKFNRPPRGDDVSDNVAFGCMAQAADDINRHYEKIKAAVITQNLQRGPEWVKEKHAMIAKLLTAGKQIQDELTKYLGDETTKAIDRIEKLMAQDIGSKSEAEEEDKDENPEEE